MICRAANDNYGIPDVSAVSVTSSNTSLLSLSSTLSSPSLSSSLPSSSTVSLQSSTLSLSPTANISPTIAIVPYPAPIPKFLPTINTVLQSGNKSQISLVYNDVIKEAQSFYATLCPIDTASAKQSMDHIGRTMVEKYPILAVSDGHTPYSFFNKKLSSALRNVRNRLKHKIIQCEGGKHKKMKITVNLPTPVALSEPDYDKYIVEIKKESVKSAPDIDHLHELLSVTFINRREWINSSTSTDVYLTTILQKFPCFTLAPMLLIELELILKTRQPIDNFEGTTTNFAKVYWFNILIHIAMT